MRKNGVDIAKASAFYGGIAGLIYHVINRDKSDKSDKSVKSDKQLVAKPLSATAEPWTPIYQRMEEEPPRWKSTKNKFGKRKTTKGDKKTTRRARKRQTKLINLFLGGSAASPAAYEIYKNTKTGKDNRTRQKKPLYVNDEYALKATNEEYLKKRRALIINNTKRLDKYRELKLLSDNKRAQDNDIIRS